jgi:RND family efflux transporter MFP subunit
MKRKAFFTVAAIALLAVAGYATFSSGPVSGAQDQQKTSVKTMTISPAPLQETAQFSGFVRGVKQTDIAPKIGGYIVRLTKEEGDTVRQGEIIAILDGSELSAARQSALLSAASIDKQLKETKNYYDQKVDEAKSALDNASGSSSKDAAEEALKSAKRLRDAELAALKTQRAGIEGSAIISGANLADTTIRAPFTGVITRKNASLGTFIAPGMPIYSLASPDAFEVKVSLPRTIAARVSKGSSVSVSDDTDFVEASVFSIVSSADESSQQSTARIHFTSSTASQAFHLGDHVSVSFRVSEPRTALLIPVTAILSAYDDTFVYTVENGLAKRAVVVIGIASGNDREIISGLSDGAHIVTEGIYALSDNQPVQEIYAAH